MSYSKLVSYVKLSPNCTKPRNAKTDTVTIHMVVGQASVESLGELFASPERQASSNYGIGSDGRIACFVEEEDRSWCTGSRENDHRAITIEVASDTTAPYAVNDKAFAALLDLLEDICRRHNMVLNYTGDRSGNMTLHKWFQATDCPGAFLEGKHPEIAAEVNRRLGVKKPADPEPSKEYDYQLDMQLLKKGDSGDAVRALQILLKGNGYDLGAYGPNRDGVDGIYGAATARAVRALQTARGLGVDEIAGPEVMGSLLGS